MRLGKRRPALKQSPVSAMFFGAHAGPAGVGFVCRKSSGRVRKA